MPLHFAVLRNILFPFQVLAPAFQGEVAFAQPFVGEGDIPVVDTVPWRGADSPGKKLDRRSIALPSQLHLALVVENRWRRATPLHSVGLVDEGFRAIQFAAIEIDDAEMFQGL